MLAVLGPQVGAGPSCKAIVKPDRVRLVVARKNHRADRSQGRSWRLGWLTGRDDDGTSLSAKVWRLGPSQIGNSQPR